MPDKRPNVLLILTDDQGWDDLACHCNPWLETPNLDALAEESVQFSNYCVASVCAPSRASLLTGRHFLRTGVSHVHGGKDFIHRDEVLISELFQNAGYRTGMWGKWHSGKTTGYLPWERGFDNAYMAKLYKHKDSHGYLNGEYLEHEGWTCDTLTDYAVEFFKEMEGADQPFFAYVPHLISHGPLLADETVAEKYRKKGLDGNLAVLYAMIDQLDVSIGNLLKGLEQYGHAEHTIVLFMSDNGPACNEGIFTDEERALRNVNGFKGHKGNMWERGVKSPLFVRWPARLKPHTVKRLSDICDIFPTLCEACGIDIPEDHPPLDGRSIIYYLEGDEETLSPKESYIWVSPGWPPDPVRGYSMDGVFDEYGPIPPECKDSIPAAGQLASFRGEEWKLLQNPGAVPDMCEVIDGRVLIHISEDPKEEHNLVLEDTRKADDLQTRVREWFEEIKKEPHSFHTPVFSIGTDAPHTFVAAYAPERISGGLQNTGNGLRYWIDEEDGADYRVLVEKEGTYRVEIDYEKASDKSIALALCSGRECIGAALGPSGHQKLGEITLKAGEQILSLEVTDAEKSDEPIVSKVVMLRFIPILKPE